MRKLNLIESVKVLTTATAVIFVAALMAGCSVSRGVTLTKRSSVEQRLLVRSLERALAQMDTKNLKDKLLALDVYGLTEDREFAREFLLARLRERALRIVSDKKSAELELKVFLTALGVDRAERLVGIPALVAPVLDVPVPELALFKSSKNRGHTEIQLYAFDKSAGTFVAKSAPATGKAHYDSYTLLIFIHFNLNDLDEPAINDTERQR